jgi:glycosyltransferase involved in cell wall biosynthesis
MSGVERIVVHGFVADLQAFYAGMRLSVVPLRWGAGVKGKVNSAMKYGVPVVCTSVATEGMRLRHGSDALIADDPSAFADHVVRAYHDAALWHRLRAGGFENVQAHFSLASAAQGLAHVFDDVLAADDDGALEERLRLNLKRLAQGGGGGEEAPGGACGPLPAVPALDESEWGGW